MSRTRLSRLALCVLVAACATPGDVPERGAPGSEAESSVRVSTLPDGKVKLVFPPLPLDPALRRFTREEASGVLAEFHQSLAQASSLDSALARLSVEEGQRVLAGFH